MPYLFEDFATTTTTLHKKFTIDFVNQVQDFYYEMSLNDDQEVQTTSVHYKSLISRSHWIGFKMFNKKPRRNFRQRKNESSDEDENKKLSGGDAGKETEKADSKADLPRRNVSPKARECDSSDAEEPSVTAFRSKDTKHQSKSNSLSFLDEKDCEYFITTSHKH